MTDNKRIEVEGFPAEYHSDTDGDRYVIVDAEDYDLTGWSVEVATDEERLERVFGASEIPVWARGTNVEEFTRTHPWYRSFKDSPWGYLCFSKDTAEYPWSALVDHGKYIVRWIPPSG
jgi:hypothetical protein